MALFNVVNYSMTINGAAWIHAIERRGVTLADALSQYCLLSEKVAAIVANAQWHSCYLPSGEEQPFAAEFLFDNKTFTVVTHLPHELGKGFYSKVTSSIVSLSIDITTGSAAIQPGTLLAAKLSENREQLLHEQTYTNKCTGASHVRQLVGPLGDHQKPRGLLLMGMEATLKTISDNRYFFDDIEKITIAKHLLNGLVELQERNIVHRDLHIANCGRSFDGIWQIHDLGCAATVGEKVDHPANRAVARPEHLDGPYVVSTKDDMWGLALILYEIEYRKTPLFCTENELIKAKEGDVVRFRAHVEGFIKELFEKPLEATRPLLHDLILALASGRELADCLKIISGCELAGSSEIDTASLSGSTSSDCKEAVSGYVGEGSPSTSNGLLFF